MRLFIAINLNDEMKEAVMDIQDTMMTYGIRGKATVPENMHLTLAFIGEYGDPDHVRSVVDSIEISPFEISLRGIGAFHDLWWVGIENSAPLKSVAKRLRRALAEADIPYDRKKFSPHITMIRRAEGRLEDAPAEELAKELTSFGVSMTVDHISLMRSDRGRHGMIYTEL
ncbi:MAG: RNA 2',3'-cyclic phosphodiesterase [Mogibacterium sp.]|nr:RNA 2',3'-cyclic phosphodiesterase [Mogibacterium sp.]